MLQEIRPLPHTLVGDDDGRSPGYDSTACLLKQPDGGWMVAWFERGSHQHRAMHDSEHEACLAFLDLLGLSTSSYRTGIEASAGGNH